MKSLLQESARTDKEADDISSMPGIGGTARRAFRLLAPYLSFLPFMRNQRKESLEDKVEFCCKYIHCTITIIIPSGAVNNSKSI